jgi:hypothetical protein
MTLPHLEVLVDLLDRAWRGGFSTKSNIAKAHATVVSMATERGLITTRVGPNLFGNQHYITPHGLTVLWSLKGIAL